MRHTTRFSSRLAVAITAVAALALGLGAGNLATPVGVAGALAFGWGAGALDTEANSRRALGSVATVVGGLLVLVGMSVDVNGAAVFLVSALSLLGLAAVAVDGTAGLTDETLAPVLASLGSSIATVIVGVAATSVFHVAFSVGLVVLLFAGMAHVSLATALGAFVVLQFQALLAGVLMGRARRAVEGWFPGGVPVETWEEFEPLALSVTEVPRGYWVVLGLQMVLLLVPGVVGRVEWLLASTWVFGDAVHVALTSGLLHGALLSVLLVELAVLGAEFLRSAATTALSPDPPKSLSYAAGGVVLVVGIPLLVAAAMLTASLFGVGKDLLFVDGVWGLAAAVMSLVVVALGLVFAMEVTGVAIAERSLLPDRAAGFAIGATMLFAAAISGVAAGVAPIVAFASIAAALVTWDLGETSVDIGSHLGPGAESRRAEVVHATGSLAVGLAGVVLAALAVHALGPLEVPGTGGRAAAALGLSLVALLAFVLALDRRPADE